MSNDESFKFQLLGRLKSDCDYFLGNGNACERHLWGKTIGDHISAMLELWDLLLEKPEWLTKEQILDYKEKMYAHSEKKSWLIGMGGSDADNVFISRFFGTKNEVKQYLVKKIKEYREDTDDIWDHGTECATEVTPKGSALYAYGCFNDHHIDYVAREESSIKEVAL